MNERARVTTANRKAKRLGAEGDLSLDEWLQTLAFFGRACAYCGGPFEALEHVDGLAGGTRADNCVPACTKCNNVKGTHTSADRPIYLFLRVALRLLPTDPATAAFVWAQAQNYEREATEATGAILLAYVPEPRQRKPPKSKPPPKKRRRTLKLTDVPL